MKSLRETTIISILWTYLQRFSTQIVNFVVSIVLARLLLPSDFGLIGAISIFIAMATIILNGGLAHSLLRTRELDENDLSTVFYFNVGVGFILYLLLYLTAPYIASFFRQDVLIKILRVYGLTFIISSLASVPTTILMKKLEFKRYFYLTLPGTIVGNVVGLIMAYSGYGVWSLVFMNLSTNFIMCVMMFMFINWKPKWIFSEQSFIKHFKFGLGIMMSNMLDVLFTNIYQVFIGRIYSPTYVGYYTRSNSLMMLPVENIANVLNSVVYPIFSKIQDDQNALRTAYSKIMQMVLFGIFPLIGIMLVTAHNLVIFLFTEKWVEIVPIFQILCLAGFLYPIHNYNLLILQIKGKVKLYLKLEVLKKIILIAIVYFTYPYGLTVMLWGQVVYSIISLVINLHYAGKDLNYSTIQQLADILPIFIATMVMCSIVYLLSDKINSYFSNTLSLIICVGLGFVVYGVISAICKIKPFLEYKALLLNFLSKKALLKN